MLFRSKRYLNIPIKNGSKRSVTTLVDGKVHVRNDIGLADAAPDWWAFMDVSAWRGKTVTFQVDAKLPLGSTALSSIEQSEHDQRCGKHLSREAKRKSTLPKIPSRHSRTVTLTDGRGGCHTAIGKEKISVCVLYAVLFAVQ